MARSGFSRALKPVLVIEGGKVDDPDDPGGRTNQGVTQAVYNAWLRGAGRKPKDVYLMTPMERDAIYKKRYWDVIGGDKLPEGVDYCVFDGAVNSGASQSVKWLQRALGTHYRSTVDGQMGVMTLEAVVNYPNHDQLIDFTCDRRKAFLRALRTYKKYGKGWERRVNDVEKRGQAWASGNVGPPINHIPLASVKARIEDAKSLPVKAIADAGVGAGGTVTTASGTGYGFTEMFDTTKSTLSELWYIETIQYVLLGITVLGLVIGLGSGAYRWYAHRKEAKLRDALDLDAAPVRADVVETADA